MSGEQTAGGLEDIDYVHGFYDELAPVHINYIAALNGAPGVPLENGFDYCELGCGLGEVTSVLAAADSAGRFCGIDLSASHIRQAAQMAEQGRLTNARFVQADIETLDLDTLPQFDFITMHGLYAWVPESTRQAISRFIDAKLKPGGLVAVSYNSYPGTQSLSIVRRYAVERAQQMDGDLLSKAERVVAELEELRSAGAPLFAESPAAARFVEILRDNDKHYVVHELFATGWAELSIRDVHRAMSGIGLRYVGDGETLENFPEHCCHEKFVTRVREMKDRIEAEAFKDFVHNRCFRRDVYRRPGRDESAGATGVDGQLLCMGVATAELGNTVKVYAGELKLDGAWFERAKELLAFDVRTMGEILGDPSFAQCPPDDLREGLLLATIAGLFRPALRRGIPLPPAPPRRFRIASEFNRQRIASYGWERPRLALASPVIGSRVSVSRMEAMLLESFETDDPRAAFESRLRTQGLTLTDVAQQKKVSLEQEAEAAGKIVNAFLNTKLPKLFTLGIVESADESN